MIVPLFEYAGHGVVLNFRVPDVGQVYDRGRELGAILLGKPEYNSIAHRVQFSLRDLDNYFITIFA